MIRSGLEDDVVDCDLVCRSLERGAATTKSATAPAYARVSTALLTAPCRKTGVKPSTVLMARRLRCTGMLMASPLVHSSGSTCMIR